MAQKCYADVEGITLEVPWWWIALSTEIIQAHHNGVGPARLSPDVVAILDKVTDCHPAGCVHDLEYAVWTDAEHKHQADVRFKWNCYRCCWKKLNFWSPTIISEVLARIAEVRILYRAVCWGGRGAFASAEKIDMAAMGIDLSKPPAGFVA